jgi:Flp pilus assembly protein TadD
MTFYNRGIAYARAGDMVQAVLDFTEAIALMPNYVDAFNNRGFAFEILGERERAEADFLTAYRLQPDNPRFRRKLLDLGLGAALTQ